MPQWPRILPLCGLLVPDDRHGAANGVLVWLVVVNAPLVLSSCVGMKCCPHCTHYAHIIFLLLPCYYLSHDSSFSARRASRSKLSHLIDRSSASFQGKPLH
jgi:hypothetical protein